MFSFKASPSKLKGNNANKTKGNKTNYLSTKNKKPSKQTNYIEIKPRDENLNYKNEYFYVDRPETPVYVPLEKMKDQTTQIERRDWLLFDFDEEVAPLLQVIVPKILEQSRFEIIWENSIQKKAKENHKYEMLRNARIHKIQRRLYKKKRHDQETKIREKQGKLSRIELDGIHKKL